jgi:hypothetical protein
MANDSWNNMPGMSKSARAFHVLKRAKRDAEWSSSWVASWACRWPINWGKAFAWYYSDVNFHRLSEDDVCSCLMGGYGMIGNLHHTNESPLAQHSNNHQEGCIGDEGNRA